MPPYNVEEPVKIWFKNIIFDENNPNEQSSEQDASMGESLQHFGVIGDLVVVNTPDDKGKQLVHHGEHRIKKMMAAGNEWCWGFEKFMDEMEHRLFRQTMNKLRGSHDLEKDRAELAFFAEENKLDFLAKFIAQPAELLIVEQEVPAQITTDESPIAHHEDTFLHNNIKQIYIMFTNEQFEEIMAKIEIMHKDLGIDNNTDLFIKLTDMYFENKERV